MSFYDEENPDVMELKNSSPVVAEVALAVPEKPVPQRSPRHASHRHINVGLITMAIPGIIVLLVMAYLPMAGVLIAFKNYLPYEGFFGSAWVGLQNFRFLLGQVKPGASRTIPSL